MQVLRWMRMKSLRMMCFALFLCLIPASSRAGVFISVGIAPPPLPVVAVDDQPPCPEPGWIWTPGYWAYGDDGYYWVPGTWVPAPEPGLLWTPGYWGWNAGLYVWHPGYWGPHVGYYGGVNYGFGYFGLGFVGGMWRGHDFVYNTAVWHVNRTVIHNVYEDRRDFRDHEVDRDRDRHISYSGGPGGIRHDPDRDEREAFRDHHWGASDMQSRHEFSARGDRNAYFNNNHGRPDHPWVERPMDGQRGGNPEFIQRGNQNIHQAPNGQFNNGQQHGQNQPDQHNWQQQQQHNWNQPQQPQQPQQQHNWNQPQQPQQQHNWNEQQHNPQQPQQPQRQWQPQPEQRQWQQPQPQHQPPPQPQQPQWQHQQPQWQQHQQPQPQPQQRQWQQPQQHNNPPPPQQPHNNPPPPQQPHNNPPPQQHGGGGNDHDHGHH